MSCKEALLLTCYFFKMLLKEFNILLKTKEPDVVQTVNCVKESSQFI